ncbi:MAG: crossover junction endodeoxyribonuclease RuvC [Gammaproteobacteria bacterium RIFCSPHIGHO2_12_FULL_40_19]|nr:MAG: crossover junction endodeoxyribonuclease RuvC [Gammaproteobacteria bacterium RIFCSPHIGHO2_12_FULL_40_19]
MTIILGIDPGSIRTGFGIIKSDKNKLSHIAHGTISAKGKTVSERLHDIHQKLCDIIAEHNPVEAAIEEVFMQINVQSALKLGQARGAAMVALAHHALPVSEYSPREIKKTASGYGAATKEQMQFMVKTQLSLPLNPQADAADALAIAICHSQHRAFLSRITTQ